MMIERRMLWISLINTALIQFVIYSLLINPEFSITYCNTTISDQTDQLAEHFLLSISIQNLYHFIVQIYIAHQASADIVYIQFR
jgi:hypothetical protein